MCRLAFNPLVTESVAKHLTCSDTLCCRRVEFASKVVEAYTIVLSFANTNNWKAHIQKPLFTSVHIYESQKLWKRIRKVTGSVEKHPPTNGLCAAICNSQLMAVAPNVYNQIRPEYARIKNAWTKLLAHEMIHQLHIRLVGMEEKMGPQWFFEGFAMHGAGQHFGIHITSIQEAINAMHNKSRGSYAKYVAAFEFFIDRIDLNLMLKRAAEHDFESWLITLASSTNNNIATEPDA